VTCDAVETERMLSVSDNGKGNEKHLSAAEGGLGTGIVAALARQLNAEIVTESGPERRCLFQSLIAWREPCWIETQL
jgi:two-component sensor histidine kinase